MGSDSKSSSASTSSEVADSYNTITTPTSTASGAGSISLANTGNLGGSRFNYASDSNNTSGSNNSTNSYGASSPIDTSAGTAGAAPGGFDWGEVAVWVVGGLALTFVLKYVAGDKNV
jgi:hypothetical protein